MRRILEGIKNRNLIAVIRFFDFKKAFDTINRKPIQIAILKSYGIPPRMPLLTVCKHTSKH